MRRLASLLARTAGDISSRSGRSSTWTITAHPVDFGVVAHEVLDGDRDIVGLDGAARRRQQARRTARGPRCSTRTCGRRVGVRCRLIVGAEQHVGALAASLDARGVIPDLGEEIGVPGGTERDAGRHGDAWESRTCRHGPRRAGRWARRDIFDWREYPPAGTAYGAPRMVLPADEPALVCRG